MAAFRLLIDYDVVEFVEQLPKSYRRILRDRFVAIRDYPAAHADYTEPDAQGRAVAINICGSYAIKYWVDHADRHIKILDVHLADRQR